MISAVASLPPKRARSKVLPIPTAVTVITMPFCETVATPGESVVQTTGADTTSPVLVRIVAVTSSDRGSPGGAARFMEAGESLIEYVVVGGGGGGDGLVGGWDWTSVLLLHAAVPSVVMMNTTTADPILFRGLIMAASPALVVANAASTTAHEIFRRLTTGPTPQRLSVCC